MPDVYNQSQGSNLAPRPPYFSFDFFVYELDFSNLVHGTSQTLSFTVNADSDFLWTHAAYAADLALAAQTESGRVLPLVTAMITDTGSGRQLMSTAVPVPSIFGTGQLPYVLPRQRRFAANSQVSITLLNYSAAADYNLRLSLIGEKGFRQ